MPELPQIYDESDLQKLNQLLESCAQTAVVIDACKQCGLRPDKVEQENGAQWEIAKRLKATFFPNSV